MAEEQHGAGRARPWLRALLVVGLAAWAQIGVDLVDWAQRRNLVEDISFSPYHAVGYAALAVLAVYVAWAFFGSLRRGGWRTAFPPLYGGLGLALVLLVGWVVLDIVWRGTLGINDGVEGGLAPPRLLIPAALVLLAIGPLREAIADRARPGVSAAELRVRWAGVVAAALVGGALTISVFNPVRDPNNDWSVRSGVDATEIWTMAADGSGQTRLLVADGNGVDYSLPAWSPDGSRIAYTLWSNKDHAAQNVRNQDQTAEIWTMKADGSDRRIVPIGQHGQAWIPAWSPDGQWIAYTLSPLGLEAAPAAAGPQPNAAPGQVGPPTGSVGASIWIAHPDGSDNRRLTPEGVDALNLAWSPDGKQVAFSVAANGANTDIHVATLTGAVLSNEHAIAADPANDWNASWSPDGKRLVFTSDRSGIDELWVANADGGAPTQLTAAGAGDRAPSWSPDGSRIAFTSDRTGEPEVWSIAADGSDARNLTNHPQHYDGQWSMAWSPDSKHIAYATGSFGDASTSFWVHEDFAAAQAILFGIALAAVALLIAALGAPFGSFALALAIIVGLGVFPTEGWRFLPGAVLAGLLTDVLVRAVRLRYRARVAAAAFPALANLAVGLTIGAGGSLAWSITLLLGVSVASAVLGLGLADAAERLFPRAVATPAPEGPAG